MEETGFTGEGYRTGSITGDPNNGETVIVSNITDGPEYVSVEALKEWTAGTQTAAWPEDVDSVAFTLYKTVNGVQSVVTTDDVSGITNPVTISSSTAGSKAVWDQLPTKYPVASTWYEAVYSVVETKIIYNEKSGKTGADTEQTVSIPAVENGPQTLEAKSFKVTNPLEPTSIHVTKQWQNKDGDILGTAGKEIPSEAKVTFTLYAGETPVTTTTEEGGQAAITNRSLELSGSDATSGGTVTPSVDDYEANWTAYFTNLPKYDADGKIIEYTVRETGTWTGYMIQGSGTEQTATTNDQGLASFSSLTVGYYIVTETDPSPGYVITGEDSFYIEVTDTGISMLTKGDGACTGDGGEHARCGSAFYRRFRH